MPVNIGSQPNFATDYRFQILPPPDRDSSRALSVAAALADNYKAQIEASADKRAKVEQVIAARKDEIHQKIGADLWQKINKQIAKERDSNFGVTTGDDDPNTAASRAAGLDFIDAEHGTRINRFGNQQSLRSADGRRLRCRAVCHRLSFPDPAAVRS